ncbi:MAG: hypothetical protein GXO76_04850 [Calditrichaeota bacterium]|nr:hypothetical protein [Calditrichota bacterium]
MAEIRVSCDDSGDGFACQVAVTDSRGSKSFDVTVLEKDYKNLTGGKIPVEELIKKSFEFLLKREPKESILRQFDLMVIARYFPEYEQEIKKALSLKK